MIIEPYNNASAYKVGDLCSANNNRGAVHPDDTYQRLNFICRKDHPANATALFHAPTVEELFPNDPKYPLLYNNYYLFWEPLIPEWDEYEVYREGDICQYNGTYYVLTWRADKVWYEPQSEYVVRILSGQPDLTEDENGVRIWAINYGRKDNSSFGLVAFNLDRFYDNFYSQKKCPSPYGDPHGVLDNEVEPSTQETVGDNNRKNGFSLEVFQYYEDYFQAIYPYVTGEEESEGEPVEPTIVNVWEGGITEASRCGCAFQRQGYGIGFNGYIAAINLDTGLFETNAYQGKIVESPPYQDPNNLGVFITKPEVPASGNPNLYFLYAHNHPLFFRRKVKVRSGFMYRKVAWKAVLSVPPSPIYENDYVLKYRNIYYSEERVCLPNDDCFAHKDYYLDPIDQQPLNQNSIGRFYLPTSDMSESILDQSNGEVTPPIVLAQQPTPSSAVPPGPPVPFINGAGGSLFIQIMDGND